MRRDFFHFGSADGACWFSLLNEAIAFLFGAVFSNVETATN
jgi:hypothetical protein